jgi:hypothetical protein
MEMKFLTLLNNHNDLMDWFELWFGEDTEGLEEPKEFPCYASSECVDYDDEDNALFAPHYIYIDDVKEMLDNLE